MRNITTMIMAGGKGKRLYPLTRNCAKPAIRFGGMYCIIDFTLSNCLNSGIRRIYILTQYASASIERYIHRGWAYLFRSEFSEFIETRPPQHIDYPELYQSTANSVYQNLNLLKTENSESVLILSGDHIYKMDYRKMYGYHRDHNAELTIACVDLPLDKAKNMGVVEVDEKMNIIGFTEKPQFPKPLHHDADKALCNMGVYIFRVETLKEVLRKDAEDPASEHDFGKNIIPDLIASGAKVVAYQFWDENKKESKYWRDIGTIDAYYEANIDLLAIDPLFNLYDREWPIRCFVSQAPPAKTVFNWRDVNRVGNAIESMLSPGVIVSGGQVIHSILSPNVKIHSYSQVVSSILLDGVEIGRNAVIKNAIIDHNVVIPPGAKIGIDLEQDREIYTVSEGGITVVAEQNE